MNRRRLISAVLVASLLIGATIIYALFVRTPMQDFHEVDTARLPVLDYCEVKNNPRLYNGKVIKVRAWLGQFLHGMFFEDRRCKDEYYEELLDDGRTALTLHEPKRGELWTACTEILKSRRSQNAVPVIAVGRFEWKYPSGTSDGIEDRTSFHFELYAIEPAT